MAKYIVDPLIVDKTFGSWILSRKFVDKRQYHCEFSDDKQVFMELQCITETEFTFCIAFHYNRVNDLSDIVNQLMQQMHFSKNEMLETAKLFIPQMKRFVFVLYSDHTLNSLPAPIEGVTILDLSNRESGICFNAIFE